MWHIYFLYKKTNIITNKHKKRNKHNNTKRMSNKVIFDESIDNFFNGFIDKTAATSNSNQTLKPEFFNAININKWKSFSFFLFIFTPYFHYPHTYVDAFTPIRNE